MTAILTVSTTRGVVQVTDRLVTLNRSGETHDQFANKSIICRLADGIFTLSYSGPAYFGALTTDTWIATNLWGGELPKHGIIAGAARDYLPDIGRSVMRLRDALREFYTNQPKSYPSCYIVAAGVQADRPPRIAAYEIKAGFPSKPHDFEISKAPRDIPRGKFVLQPSPGVLLPDEEEALRREIRACESIDALESALVTGVRRISDRDRAVGPACMSIVIASSIDPNIRARFIPRSSEQRVLGERQLAAHGGFRGEWIGTPAQIGFSPYILGQRSVHFPSALVGSVVVKINDLRVLLDAPDPGAPRFGMSSQQRPPPPRRFTKPGRCNR